MVLFWMLIAAAEPEIESWHLPNEEKRQELTRQYIETHCGEPCLQGEQYPVEMIPKMVVVHWTAGSTAKSAWNTFASATLSGRKNLVGAGALNVSSQYLIDRDGRIYELLPPTRIARHCIGLNHLSIGIENVGDGKKYPITDAQIASNIALVRYLKEKYPITHLIGHHEHNEFRLHPYFRELDPKYHTSKPDPGDFVMRRIREAVLDLNLEGVPKDKSPQE